MARRRRGHKLWRDGPGRHRTRIAGMLEEQLGILVDPADIHCNSSPADRLLDLCRWCVSGTRDGRHIHVCSWDRMGDIIKAGGLAVACDDWNGFEVCAGKPPAKEGAK